MTSLSKKTLFWAPRALSIAFIVLWKTLQALAVHLIPCYVLIAVLVLAWRWEWIGAALYTAAGLVYIRQVVLMARPIPPAVRLNWVLTISGPAFVIAGLFLANWLKRSELGSPGR